MIRFLFRTVFWLGIVVLLLPGDPNSGTDAPRVSAMQALVATRSAIADFSTFCDRNPQACATGSTAVQVFASKVRYGAELLSGYLNHNQDGGRPRHAEDRRHAAGLARPAGQERLGLALSATAPPTPPSLSTCDLAVAPRAVHLP